MQSWIESANSADTEFPLQNLPFGVASIGETSPRCVTAIGDYVLDLAVCEQTGLLRLDAGGGDSVFAAPSINAFMALGAPAWARVREQLLELLREGGDARIREATDLREQVLRPLAEATLRLPIRVNEYTDFYAGKQHAFNVGSIFRGPENALPPNWLHIPIGYNGRASTVVVSGTPVHRPLGQLKSPEDTVPRFGPCERLDIELELGAVVGIPNRMGEPVTVTQADDMIFGYVLLNDWSARDIQAWEYQPLGPFQGKAFGTTISPWVVTKAALEPFRTSTPEREVPLLPYLVEHRPMSYDIHLETTIRPAGGTHATTLSRTNASHLYYSAAQQLAHHAIGGCQMNTGDLLGSGTISGPSADEYGSLLEMSWGGKHPIKLESGETRTFIEDGDELTLRGWCEGEGHRIGFGDCAGVILPAKPFSG